MYQLATPIWNEIARTQEMRTEWGKVMAAPDLQAALAPVVAALEAQGVDARTMRAYLTVAPMLAENLAISRWMESSGAMHLRSSLPELTTVRQAMTLASAEFNLTKQQTETLAGLLQSHLTELPSVPVSAKRMAAR